MTRAEIKQFARSLLAEDPIDSPGTDPFLENRWVDQATNEICRATGCYFLSYTTDIVNGQQIYCAAPLYQIRSVVATLSDGTPWLLTPYTAKQLDNMIGGYWRPSAVNPTLNQGDPICYIPDGLNGIRLYPVPNYSLGSGALAGSVTVSGGAITAIAVSEGGSGYFDAPTVQILDATGTGAAAHTEIMNGVVTSIVVDAEGSDYTSPTIVFHAGGLTFEGFAVPTDSGESLWPLETDECPIPARGHEGIGYKLASLRCLPLFAQTGNQNYMVLKQQFDTEYKLLKGYVESEAAKYTNATKYRARVGGRRHAYWGGIY
ncbi:MAG TPA: hypothetical protein VJQ82_17190 [Terriglobales bacterium]|nr:hypothetical protein [Terriglobales bacterium]